MNKEDRHADYERCAFMRSLYTKHGSDLPLFFFCLLEGDEVSFLSLPKQKGKRSWNALTIITKSDMIYDLPYRQLPGTSVIWINHTFGFFYKTYRWASLWGPFYVKSQTQLTFLLAPPRDTLGLVLKSPSKLNIVRFFPLTSLFRKCRCFLKQKMKLA